MGVDKGPGDGDDLDAADIREQSGDADGEYNTVRTRDVPATVEHLNKDVDAVETTVESAESRGREEYGASVRTDDAITDLPTDSAAHSDAGEQQHPEPTAIEQALAKDPASRIEADDAGGVTESGDTVQPGNPSVASADSRAVPERPDQGKQQSLENSADEAETAGDCSEEYDPMKDPVTNQLTGTGDGQGEVIESWTGTADRDDPPDHAIHAARDQQDAAIPLIGHEDHGSSDRTRRGEVPQESYPHLTDQEWVEHLKYVSDQLDKARAEGLTSTRLYTIDPDGQSWARDRRALHDVLINDLYANAQDVPNAGCAIIAGGLGGAGKTTVLTEYAGIDLSQYLTINPDNLKEEMARRGMIPMIEGTSPMEASDLVHEESSYLARQLALQAQADGKNLIWDITMSDKGKTEGRISDLRKAGYDRIAGIFVDIPVETSIERTASRHREGHEEYRAGNGMGGRYVPPEVITDQKDDEWGSRNRKTFEAIKERLNSWSIYDNSVNGGVPRIVGAG